MVNFIIKLTHFYSKNLMQMMKDLILLWLMLFFLFPPTAVIKSVMITKLKSSCNLLISGRILYSCSVRTRSVYHWVCQNNTHTHTHTHGGRAIPISRKTRQKILRTEVVPKETWGGGNTKYNSNPRHQVKLLEVWLACDNTLHRLFCSLAKSANPTTLTAVPANLSASASVASILIINEEDGQFSSCWCCHVRSSVYLIATFHIGINECDRSKEVISSPTSSAEIFPFIWEGSFCRRERRSCRSECIHRKQPDSHLPHKSKLSDSFHIANFPN